jgi:PD-(D/E)XK endonuclease
MHLAPNRHVRAQEKGDLAELMVACDLRQRGCKLAIPYGEDCDYDLVIERDGRLEQVQVKHTESDGAVMSVKGCSHSLTNGRVRETKRYTTATIDWLAVYDRTTDRCYYIPARELGDGRRELRLRVTHAKNNQRAKIRFATDYLDLRDGPPGSGNARMEPAGFEPATFRMQTGRSPS